MSRFAVSPDDCLVLLAVGESDSLREAARRLRRDPAGLLRKVQRLAQEHGYLEKVRGRWALAPRAEALVAWTRESILSQGRALEGQETLRIASTAWFAERVLIPRLGELAGKRIRLSVPSAGFERAIIDGDCDFVVACHPPENPVIAHKQVMKEPWSVVFAPALIPARRRVSALADLGGSPFVRHEDANPEALFPLAPPFELRYSLSVDNLIGVRAAVRSGLGWSFVPTALVADELANGSLRQVGERYELDRKICLWWLRGGFAGKKRLQPLLAFVRAACERI